MRHEKAEKIRKPEAFKEISGFEEPAHKSPHLKNTP